MRAAAAPGSVVDLRKRFASRLPWLTVDARGGQLNEREPADTIWMVLGAGRLEGRTALSALFSRFPALELTVGPGCLYSLPSHILDGHQEIPVRLEGNPNS
ncbi:hypothetical protein ACFW9N_41130 [Streptomyces sp. NPDC059496]|uniref:hypothetical protein n=1 Tax=Streptomyces sp. NPDC059496 TaxID=3346851 RepID=UPI0036B3D0B0